MTTNAVVPCEFAVAASYYTLYYHHRQQQSSRKSRDLQDEGANNDSNGCVTAATMSTPAAAHDDDDDDNDNDSNQKVPVWVEDDWTEQDERQAEAIIRDNLEKCRIPSQQYPRNKNYREEAQAESAWNRFYTHHQTNFFKDRHYLATAFPQEFGSDSNAERKEATLVEIGCGVGNALLPLLQDDSNNDSKNNDNNTKSQLQQATRWTVHGVDFSAVAIAMLAKDNRFQAAAAQGRAAAYVASLVPDDDASLGHAWPIDKLSGIATVSTLLFCLSAIPPGHHAAAAQRAASTLQPGGVLVLRDYGRYDQAQLQLATQRHKLVGDDGDDDDSSFYMKHDGTKCYYFTTHELRRLFGGAGLEVLDLRYLRRAYQNRGTGATRRRVWVQGRFRKPSLLGN